MKNEGCVVWEKSFNILICRGAFLPVAEAPAARLCNIDKKTLCAISRIAKILLTSVANYIIIIL